ncbi:hypothetical protein [Leptolyngbya sp. FACHB-711]|uniref:hypothetical protein n=1 Tax=unclassified Leptolyngbya TaxID=2650499 RepID=UPI0019A4A3E1|nr:hypothetical protein [Leptolyngbya sp. FACHB-711]MBD2024188.1 hypothetical protein [Leptolyngbya sp. FACHB-711]
MIRLKKSALIRSSHCASTASLAAAGYCHSPKNRVPDLLQVKLLLNVTQLQIICRSNLDDRSPEWRTSFRVLGESDRFLSLDR